MNARPAHQPRSPLRALLATLLLLLSLSPLAARAGSPGENPLLRDCFTADPAPLVVGDTVYLYTGHDQAKDHEMFTMWEWLCYSSKDMKTWTPHGPIMHVTDFKWAVRDAWASQCVQKNGKFYFYAAVRHDNSHPGMAIGVAVSDSPTGPFKDARGSALITDDMTPSPNPWDDIDPTILIDDDGTPWLCWGNPNCYLARLKPNMIDLDGPIQKIHLPNYTEGPWLQKRGNLYYLLYSAFAHQGMWEKICYATAPRITGPWTYRGIITGQAANSYTIHCGVVPFHGQSYFFYHNAALTIDGQKGALGRRSVCLEYLYYNPDGTIQPITQTKEGVSLPPKGPAPAPEAAPVPASSTPADTGVIVTQNAGDDPTSWPGHPLLSTVQNPYYGAVEGMSFSNGRGAATLSQTFTLPADTRLKRIAIFAGDGLGTSPDSPVTLALYDLGEHPSSTSYEAGINLLGSGKGLPITCQPQAPGLLLFDFLGDNQVLLKSGHTYAFELQGTRKSAPLFWRYTRKDTSPAGAAFIDRSLLTGKSGTSDFALAIYGDPDSPQSQ